MQTAETCPQEEPLKQVLETLGLAESQLKDLRAIRGVVWRLFCRVANFFDSFCRGFWG